MIGVTCRSSGRMLRSASPGGLGDRPVPLTDVKSLVSTLRAVRTALTTTASQVSARRLAVIAVAVVILVAVVVLVPLPTAVQLRDWATSVGPWFPVAFLAAHVVVTVFPFPRTAFTLSAGLLFGPVLGVALAVVASTLSAVIALALVRAAGWHIDRLIAHPRIDMLNARLQQRGWPTVLAMRLIPAVPFSVLNYAAGASAVRAVPYTLASFVGLLPGTAAIVILGDALTGNVSPLLFLVSACTAAVGVAGLTYEVRTHRRNHPVQTADREPTDLQTDQAPSEPVVTPRSSD